MLHTTNLNLNKPLGTENFDIATQNQNMDIIDVAVSGKVDKVTGKQLSTEDYTTTEKNALALKLNISSYTAADILTKIKTVDGAGSGLDANLLDGMTVTSAANGNTVMSRDPSGDTQLNVLHSYAPNGQAPFTVVSSTKVTNLNADLLRGYLPSQAPFANNIPVLDANMQLNIPNASYLSIRYSGTAMAVNAGVTTKILYDTVDNDVQAEWNATNKQFVIKSSGVYQITATALLASASSIYSGSLTIFRNNAQNTDSLDQRFAASAINTTNGVEITGTMKCTAGDMLDVRIYSDVNTQVLNSFASRLTITKIS